MRILLPDLPPHAFAKEDRSDDLLFYAPPRFVNHIDETAVTALTSHYRSIVPAGGTVFDVMSSWVSHLPHDVGYGEVIGHGMNSHELAANPRLTRWFVQDLNNEPTLPLTAKILDAALCCVGVQYLERPVEVFTDVRRTLKLGAPFVVSFSNRCFPTKAVAVWLALDTAGHAGLVRLYLERAGFGAIATHVLVDGTCSDPLVAVTGYA